MSTLDQLIDETLVDYLLAGQREPRNVLAADVDDVEGTVSLAHEVKAVQEGAKISVGFEDMHVVSSNPGAKTAAVIRGQYGTEAAPHATGDTVWVNAKWTRAQVLRAVNAELDVLSGQGLFQMASVGLTYSPAVQGYDLGVDPDDVIDVWEVRADEPGPTNRWRTITNFQVVRDAPADFPSGIGLVLFEPGFPGHEIRVAYKTRFTQVTPADASDDLSDTAGLDREAHDLLGFGVAVRLLLGKEVQRNQLNAQPDTRRAEEVPPGAALQSVNGLVRKRDERLREEKARLARRYPMRKQVA